MTTVAGTRRDLGRSLTFYRIMAYVTGTLLIVLTVAVVVKYTTTSQVANDLTTYVGIAHGWLFILYLLTVLNLAMKSRMNWWRVIVVGLCGTIPVMTFVAERSTVRHLAPPAH